MIGEGSTLPGFVAFSDMVSSKSVVEIKPCDCSVVIRYQVDEVSCTWLVEDLDTHTFTLGLLGKV